MIVDCHTHIGSAVIESVPSEHLAAMETVDACIVLAESKDSNTETNKQLSEYVNSHSEKTVGFAVVDPTKDDISIKNITSISDKQGLHGVVLYCSNACFHPTDSDAMRFYETAQELSLPIFFHNAGYLEPQAILNYAQPFLLDEIARTFPDLKIIIGTMGMPFVEQTLAMVAKHKNVYADLTVKTSSVWRTYNTVVAAYEYNVMDKLLFGSGFPGSKQGQCIETLLGFNKLLADTNLPTVPRDNIRNIIERDTLELLGIKR